MGKWSVDAMLPKDVLNASPHKIKPKSKGQARDHMIGGECANTFGSFADGRFAYFTLVPPSSTSTFTKADKPSSAMSRAGGRVRSKIKGSTPCKANCPCTSAGDAERGRDAGVGAGHQRCRTAAADYTAGCRPEHQGAIGMPSSPAVTPRKRSSDGVKSRHCCEQPGR